MKIPVKIKEIFFNDKKKKDEQEVQVRLRVWGVIDQLKDREVGLDEKRIINSIECMLEWETQAMVNQMINEELVRVILKEHIDMDKLVKEYLTERAKQMLKDMRF